MIAHTHLSGRFTATPSQEEAALDECMHASGLVTTSEVDANLRARCLREPGWTAIFGDKGPRDDCGLAVRNSVAEVVDGYTKSLSDLRYRNERGHLTGETVGAFGVLRTVWPDVGSVGVVGVLHTPHGMGEQLRTGHITSDVAKTYRSILVGMRKEMNVQRRAHNADWSMVVGDMNLDLRMLWVQAYLHGQFPSYRTNWSKPYPTRGTFDGRIIDIAFLRGIRVAKQPVILDHFAGFDHRGFREILV